MKYNKYEFVTEQGTFIVYGTTIRSVSNQLRNLGFTGKVRRLYDTDKKGNWHTL